MKLYENFISDLKNDFNYKIEIIEEYVNFMEKYSITYLPIFSDNSIGLTILSISKEKNKYEIELETDGPGLKKFDTNLDIDIFDLLDTDKQYILNLENLLNQFLPWDTFFNIIKNSDLKGIDLNEDIFEKFDDKEDIKKLNSFEFQDLLFTKHKKLALEFLKHIDSKFNTNNNDEYIIKLHKKIKKNYSSIIYEYEKSKKVGEFNI